MPVYIMYVLYVHRWGRRRRNRCHRIIYVRARTRLCIYLDTYFSPPRARGGGAASWAGRGGQHLLFFSLFFSFFFPFSFLFLLPRTGAAAGRYICTYIHTYLGKADTWGACCCGNGAGTYKSAHTARRVISNGLMDAQAPHERMLGGAAAGETVRKSGGRGLLRLCFACVSFCATLRGGAAGTYVCVHSGRGIAGRIDI